MHNEVKQVAQGVALAQEASISMRQMEAGTARVADAIAGISDLLHEQTSASEQMSGDVQQVAETTERNGASMRGVKEAAGQLESVARRLQDAVRQFRICLLYTSRCV